VPAGPVEDQRGVRAGLELPGEALQEHGHARGGRLGQGEREGQVGAGPAGGEQVKAREAPVGEPGRAHPALVPAVAGPPFLADPGLVLTPELDPHVGMGSRDLVEPRPKPIF